MFSEEEIMRQKEKRKKILMIFVCAVVGIFVVFGIIVLILSGIQNSLESQRRADYENSMKRSYVYPPADYDFNIFEDEVYMSLDRGVWINDGVTKTVIADDNYGNYSPQLQFMYNVIHLIINGDYIEYNKIFTDEYLENAGDDLRERFTMQALYNIELAEINYSQQSGTSAIDADSVIKVEYMIRNNNGTFRNDLDYNEEATRAVLYFLKFDGDDIKVTNLMPYSQYTAGLY